MLSSSGWCVDVKQQWMVCGYLVEVDGVRMLSSSGWCVDVT
jgi:hypothetical protein